MGSEIMPLITDYTSLNSNIWKLRSGLLLFSDTLHLENMDNCYQNFVESSNGCERENPNDRSASAPDLAEIQENGEKVTFYLNGDDDVFNELQTSIEAKDECFINHKQLDTNGINFDSKNNAEKEDSVNNNCSGAKICFKISFI